MTDTATAPDRGQEGAIEREKEAARSATLNDLQRAIDTIETAYAFECPAGLLSKCGEWKYLKRLIAGLSPPFGREAALREAWRDGDEKPPVNGGAEREYIVAVFRKHSGKVYSFACSYLNAMPLRYEWGCPKGGGDPADCDLCTDDGCPTTGWFLLTGNDGEGGQYEDLELRDGDKLMGWREVPRWEARAALSSSSPTGNESPNHRGSEMPIGHQR